jgi:hypothetical protein
MKHDPLMDSDGDQHAPEYEADEMESVELETESDSAAGPDQMDPAPPPRSPRVWDDEPPQVEDPLLQTAHLTWDLKAGIKELQNLILYMSEEVETDVVCILLTHHQEWTNPVA